MPSGACVVRYPGARGVVWRVKYKDADGLQVMETVGAAADGCTKRKAEAELRARLTDVQREGRRKTKPLTFTTFAREWIDTYPDAKGLKRSTRQGYKSLIDRHLDPAFGHLKLGAVSVGHVERYVAGKRRDGYAARTLNRHLNLLHALFGSAIRRGLVRSNPISSVDRPREPRRHWTILSPAEIGRVERAFTELGTEADGEPRAWLEQARVIFLTVLAIGLRRGELLGLRWRDVELADPGGAVLRVRETFVRQRADSPKSEAGERTIALGPRLAEELWEHRRRSAYQGDDERVFVSPTKGTPFDVHRYADTLRDALKRARIEKPMRPFHDGRHSALTNSAASGNAPLAIQRMAGHASFSTTQGYIDLAGVTFRQEAERLEERLFGANR